MSLFDMWRVVCGTATAFYFILFGESLFDLWRVVGGTATAFLFYFI
jgi:hypothetical protein